MIKIKWREPNNRDFTYYSNVPKDLIKRTTSIIKPYPYSMSKISFLIQNPSERIKSQLQEDLNEFLIYRATQFCYYIEGGMIYSFDTEYPIARLDKENFVKFKIDNNEWSDIKDIHYGYGSLCVVSWEKSAFATIGGQFALLDFTDNNEINKYKLEEKNIDKLIEKINVKEFIYR